MSPKSQANTEKGAKDRLKIGAVAKQTGIAVGAIRYYERLGLLKSERGENGYRYYQPQAIAQVQFIKKAQSLGFSLEDISAVLNVHKQGDIPCELVQSLLQQKIEQLETQILEMTTFKQNLEQYRDRWSHTHLRPEPGDICPLIETVDLEIVDLETVDLETVDLETADLKTADLTGETP